MIKRILISILIFTFVFVFFYMSAAFINYDINAYNWDIGGRAFVSIFGGFIGLISVIIYIGLEYNNEKP